MADMLIGPLLYLAVFTALGSSFCTAIVATSKGRDTIGWALMGLVFGIFGLLAAIGVPARNVEEDRARRGLPSSKQICPCCAETINVQASVCPWCGCDSTTAAT